MTLTANAQGQIAGKFTIPANVPVGAKRVDFLSAADTPATSSFVGRGQITEQELRLINTRINRRILDWNVDPLAQTFSLTNSEQVSAVDLWFTAKGTTNLLLQIRDASLGLPTKTVLAEALLTPADITLNTWSRFSFPPIVLDPNTEYALVIACNDAVSTVATAGLGEFDAAAQRYVTAQAYQVGVLLSSSNNLTWTAHQTKDLTFRLMGPNYVPDNQSRTITFDPINVVDADQLLVMAAVERPTEECDVVFNLTADGKTYSVTEGQPISLDERFTGEVTWSATLIGTASASPVLHRQVQCLAGKRLATGDYITRALDTKVSPSVLSVKISVYFDALLPGGSTVTATAQDEESWISLPVVATEALGEGWVEYHCEAEDLTMLSTRIKLSLAGSSLQRPRVRNLRVAIT